MKKSSLIGLFFIIIRSSLLPASEGEEILLKQALYTLEKSDSFREITSDILAQKTLPDSVKQKFVQQRRRFFVFWYPSDGLKVKSMVSFVEGARRVEEILKCVMKPVSEGNTGEERSLKDTEKRFDCSWKMNVQVLSKNPPLILLLRGASRMESLPAFLYPSKEVLFCCESEATIVAGCYRDGISEGKDEYGGEDVNDVYHLTLHLPKLFAELNTQIDEEKRYLVGLSRGGMQMFLALAKFPQLSSYFHKYVSFSGILNIDLFAAHNPDWRQKMEKTFDFDGSQSWLDKRNPILAIPKIANKQLPFLLIQGTNDAKVCLDEGRSMLQTMQNYKFTNVNYWEVEGGDHGLKNHPEYIKLILAWLKL